MAICGGVRRGVEVWAGGLDVVAGGFDVAACGSFWAGSGGTNSQTSRLSAVTINPSGAKQTPSALGWIKRMKIGSTLAALATSPSIEKMLRPPRLRTARRFPSAEMSAAVAGE